jgi:serpin B
MLMRTFLLAASILTLANCSSGKDKENDDTPGAADVVLPSGKTVPADLPLSPTFHFSDVEALAQSTASDEDVQARIDAANEFHFSLMSSVASDATKGNVVSSPLSVQAAFALLYPAITPDAAAGQQMAVALGFDADQETFHAAMHGQLRAIDEAFVAPTIETEEGEVSATLKYELVNQVWADDAFGLQAEFKDTIKRYYNSGVGSLPLRAESELSRQTINGFVEHNTQQLIKDLLPAGVIDGNTAAVLTNSIYMLADWQIPFSESSTASGTFANADGTSATVAMMKGSAEHGYVETTDFSAVSLSYAGGKLAMLLVLPTNANGFADFATAFDQTDFRAAIDGLSGREVTLTLPKFAFEWSSSLKDGLQTMGMTAVFEPNANHFSRLLTEGDAPYGGKTWIQDVVHKAKIIVNERGTEAAAATAVVIGAEDSAADEPVVFTVDRPALFFVYERAHGAIVFAGRLAQL